jgi:glycosyltransferase involved in cell wall biosynthesis
VKIILVAEGSYPYVAGGVASWVQTLVEAMPEHEFEIIAISSSRKETRTCKYELPPNLARIHDVYLTDDLAADYGRTPRLSKREARACRRWFALEEGSEEALPLLADRAKFGNSLTFLKNEKLWSLLVSTYRNEAPNRSFQAYVSAWRSLYAPAVRLLQLSYPKGDVYHAVSTGYAGLVASCLRMQHGTPFILTEHGIYAREREEELLRSTWLEPAYKSRWISYFYHLAKNAYGTADRIVSLYEGARRIQLGFGASPGRSVVIPNGVRYDVFSSLPRQTEPFGDTFVFGAIARIVPIKDIRTLLFAASLAANRIPGMQLWIMGPADEDPDYYEQCLRLAEGLQIGHLVTFTGRVHIVDILPKVDALVLSSLSEGQPLAVLEGMAAGIPWVCTDVGSCRELLEGRGKGDDGVAGYLVPPAHPAELAEAMVKLYRDPELRHRMGQAGKLRVEKRYRAESLIEAYRRLYAEVAG